MAALPLKVKIGIRDHWSGDSSPLQRTVKTLKELLGLDVVIEPEWQLLLAELDSAFPDKGIFVPIIAGHVETWCKSVIELLENDANAEWTETLLEKLKGSYSRLRLFVDVSKTQQASTSWSEARGAFVLEVPSDSTAQSAQFYPVFCSNLLDAFQEKKPRALPSHPVPPTAAGDDWADVEVDESSGKPNIVDKPTGKAQTVDFLPNATLVPRPDDLLLRPPYHLIIYGHGRNHLEIQCSHSPSLQFLADYFKRWSRVNHQDTRSPPAVEVKLQQSSFGLGLMHDRLVLSAESRYAQFEVSPTIVLALVEGILGYERVCSDGGQWTYRRDIVFKNA